MNTGTSCRTPPIPGAQLNEHTIAQFPSSDKKNIRRFVELERGLLGSNPLFTSGTNARRVLMRPLNRTPHDIESGLGT